MTRYIDANELEKRTVLVEDDDFDGEYVIPYASFEILPTVDAVPVVHAHWKLMRLFSYPYEPWRFRGEYVCSNCGYEETAHPNTVYIMLKYCPHCGAKMDKKV